MEEAEAFLKELNGIAKANSFALGPNRRIEPDGLTIQIYIQKHDLKINYETVQDLFCDDDFIQNAYVNKKDAESLIPSIKKAFSKFTLAEKPTLFTVDAQPSFFVKVAYPQGVNQFHIKKILRSS